MEDLEPIAGYANKREMLNALYIQERLTIKEISKRLEVGSATVERWMRLLGIPRRTRGGPNTPARLGWLLHRLDPRWLHAQSSVDISRATGISEAYCYKFIKGVTQTWNSASSVQQQDSNVTRS